MLLVRPMYCPRLFTYFILGSEYLPVRLEPKADHSLQSSTEINNVWSYTSTPPYIFIARCLSTGTTLYCIPDLVLFIQCYEHWHCLGLYDCLAMRQSGVSGAQHRRLGYF
jgi:hypothetical protein